MIVNKMIHARNRIEKGKEEVSVKNVKNVREKGAVPHIRKLEGNRTIRD